MGAFGLHFAREPNRGRDAVHSYVASPTSTDARTSDSGEPVSHPLVPLQDRGRPSPAAGAKVSGDGDAKAWLASVGVVRCDPPCRLLGGPFSSPTGHLLEGGFGEPLLPATGRGVFFRLTCREVTVQHQPLPSITALDRHGGALEKTVFTQQGFAEAEETAGSSVSGGEVTKPTSALGAPACALLCWVEWIRP